MSIDVKGSNCKLWFNERESKDGGTWKTYTVSVSKRDKTGNWVRAYQDVMFTRDVDASDVPNGSTFDFEGWMSVKSYRDRDGKEVCRPVLMINKAIFPDMQHSDGPADSFEQVDEDVPF